MSSLLCAIICFVVFKGYGSHPSSQITFLHIYVTCHRRGPCAGVWKDQSKSIGMGGEIIQCTCMLETESISSSPRIPAVVGSHILHTLLYPSQQGNNGIFIWRREPLTNYVLSSHYPYGNEWVALTELVLINPVLPAFLYGFRVFIKIKNTKFLKLRVKQYTNPRNFHTLWKNLQESKKKFSFPVIYKII